MARARFEVIRELGEGGMGRVSLARRELLPGVTQSVVVKRPLTDPAARARVRDEARAMARVFHGNVTQLLDAGEDEAGAFLVMEFVDGVDLHAVLEDARGAPLTAAEAAWIVHEAARGAAAVHDARDDDGAPLGLVHRDLSPQNLLASRRGDVKVADLGIAWAPHRDDRTATGLVIGNPRYMSPEQLEGRHAGAATDVFGLGRVLEELLAVCAPCEALSSVADRATRRAPASRHDSAAAFADAVRAAVDDLDAGRASLAARVTRLCDARDRLRAAMQGMLGDDAPARAPTEVAPRAEAPSADVSGSRRNRPRRLAAGAAAIVAIAVLAAVPRSRARPPAARATPPEVPSTQAAQQPPPGAAAAVSPPRPLPVVASTSIALAPPRAAPRPRQRPSIAPAPALPDAGATAVLRVNAIPWAEVSVDDGAPAHTPHAFVLPAGEHRVSARFADGASHVETVRLVAGEDRRLGLQRR